MACRIAKRDNKLRIIDGATRRVARDYGGRVADKGGTDSRAEARQLLQACRARAYGDRNAR